MVEPVEARGWKNIGMLFGGMTDKDCIKARLQRLGLSVKYDGKTPCIPVDVVKTAVNKSFLEL